MLRTGLISNEKDIKSKPNYQILRKNKFDARNSSEEKDDIVYLAGGLGSDGQKLTKSIWKVYL